MYSSSTVAAMDVLSCLQLGENPRRTFHSDSSLGVAYDDGGLLIQGTGRSVAVSFELSSGVACLFCQSHCRFGSEKIKVSSPICDQALRF